MVKPSDIPEAAIRIGLELRDQYLIAYRPTNQNWNGAYRRITIEGPLACRLSATAVVLAKGLLRSGACLRAADVLNQLPFAWSGEFNQPFHQYQTIFPVSAASVTTQYSRFQNELYCFMTSGKGRGST